MEQWHIVWTTFLTPLPCDGRGNWSALEELYRQLELQEEVIPRSASFPQRHSPRPPQSEQLSLSPPAVYQLQTDIQDLCRTDRLAGGSEVFAICITEHAVQLLMSCPAALLLQRVARLKSRTATLLSFNQETEIAGPMTWSRGVWWAGPLTPTAFNATSEFLRAGGAF